MNKRDAANPQSRILGKRVSLKSFSASTLFTLLHTFTYSISNIFLSGKSQVESWGKRTYFYITPPLSMESSQNLGSVVENYHSEICTPSLFFKDLCFCPTGKVINSLKFNVWVKKSFRNTDFLKSNIVGSQSLRQKLFS